MILDNASAHSSTNMIKLKEKMNIVFNAPYSPKFNPIELIFNILKGKVNKYPSATKHELILRIINKINKIS